jgi:tRNA (guanine6-N2)-methyltransferase
MKRTDKSTFVLESEVTQGLEFIAETELHKFGAEAIVHYPGEVEFRFSGDLSRLLHLKTVQSVSLILRFNVPRPRGLLDNTNIRLIFQQIDLIRELSPSNTFNTFFIAAAGSDSAIMNRIKAAIAEYTGLVSDREKGDLWIRIRPGRGGGWETIIRLSPRPLVTRSWRRCNLEGALNAATAYAMVMLTDPRSDDVFVNLGCGSATLLIERLAHGACHRAIGIDFSESHLRCAKVNIEAAGYIDRISLQLADMTRLPLPPALATALCADLPFGQLTGTHLANQKLYPALLGEAARISVVGARFVLITHEIRLMDTLLPHTDWVLEQTIRVNLRGLHPRIYVLRRR